MVKASDIKHAKTDDSKMERREEILTQMCWVKKTGLGVV